MEGDQGDSVGTGTGLALIALGMMTQPVVCRNVEMIADDDSSGNGDDGNGTECEEDGQILLGSPLADRCAVLGDVSC